MKSVGAPVMRAKRERAPISMPWRKGKTPTAKEFLASATYDFEKERARALQLIEEFVARPLNSAWEHQSFMGKLSGRDWSRLQGKHVDYHLTQFGA